MTSEGDARPPVVVGVDGSEESVAALRWAVRYGAATGTPVWALLAWHYPTAAGQPPVGHAPEAVNKEVEAEEKTTLAEAIGKAVQDAPGVDVEGRIRYGHPAEVLVEESGRADLLVVGRRGHTRVIGRHLGSVSQHCVNAAQCPVVVVHSHVDRRPGRYITGLSASPSARWSGRPREPRRACRSRHLDPGPC